MQAAVAEVNTAARASRALTPDEKRDLALYGNTSEEPDFANVRVLESTVDSFFIVARVQRNHFVGGRGTIYLGSNSTNVVIEKGVALPSGVFDSAICDSVISSGARVASTKLLCRTYVGNGAIVEGCGIISHPEKDGYFGNGTTIAIGNSTGGREVTLWAEVDFNTVSRAVCERSDKTLQLEYISRSESFVRSIASKRTIVSADAIILQCPRIFDSFIGTGATIEASTLNSVTILSEHSEGDQSSVSQGSTLQHALLQWGSRVSEGSSARNALLCERSHMHMHALVLDSIIGPCSGVSEGEVSHSLMGPMVGFHHQSLLIAAVWPTGKGNIGYGANVGSNHTGKSPDQEIWPGEGCFYGLGVSIKLPSTYAEAPYSLIATGVVTLPERVSFPFSLINSSSIRHPALSPSINEISPAWVLTDNIYSIIRNEMKFKSRFKARRTSCEVDVLRPDIVNLMIHAMKELEAANGRAKLFDEKKNKIYTEAEVPGLGKNYMREASRVSAIETYRRYIRHYALCALAREAAAVSDPGLLANLLSVGRTPASAVGVSDERWSHELSLLKSEFGEKLDIVALLKLHIEYLRRIVTDAEKAKARDDSRGKKITPGYSETHISAADDPVLVEARQRVEHATANLENISRHQISKL